MSVLSLAEAKGYLSIDAEDTDRDRDIQPLIDAAETYLKNAGCTLNQSDEVAKLAIKMLVNHWFENREPIGSGNKLAYGLQSLIIQLQYCYDTTTNESGGTV